MANNNKKQYGTSLEKERAKKTYKEKRLKNVKESIKRDKKKYPKLMKIASLLEKLSGTATDEGKLKKLDKQFEAIYQKSGKNIQLDAYNKKGGRVKKKGGKLKKGGKV